MYIDSLTIAALIVFVVTFAAFIRFCLLRVCGLQTRGEDEAADMPLEKHA